MSVCSVTQSCLTLCNPMDYSWPGSSVHGDSPGQNTRVGCHALLQGIFPTRELNPALLLCRWILYHLSHQGSPGVALDLPYNWTGHCCIIFLSMNPVSAWLQNLPISWQIIVLNTLGILLLILFGCCCLHCIYGIWLQSPSTHLIPGNCRREEDQDFKGHAGYIGVECMVMPLKMVVLLLSVHLLPFKCLFHLCHLHLTDLPKYLPQAPADDCFNQTRA